MKRLDPAHRGLLKLSRPWGGQAKAKKRLNPWLEPLSFSMASSWLYHREPIFALSESQLPHCNLELTLQGLPMRISC